MQVQMVDKDLYEYLSQELRPETHKHLLLLSDGSRSKVWLVGDKLTGEEQRAAQAGVHFVPYSQFPPDAVRGDCVYHSTPALVAPDAFENLHACEVRASSS
jgi:aldehyde decarbonylase